MSGVHDDLATLRDEIAVLRTKEADVALDHVEAEIARLQRERDEARTWKSAVEICGKRVRELETEITRLREERDAARDWVARIWDNVEQAAWDERNGPDSWAREMRKAKQVAEARCARLQQALRPFIPTGKPPIEYIGRFTCVSVRVNLDEYERAAEALAGLDTPADSQPEKTT